MKTLSLFLISILTAFSVFSQTTTSTVTITSTSPGNSNRNRQIMVDDKSYTLNNVTTPSADGTTPATANAVVITDLQPGQHTLQIVRNGNNGNNTSSNRNSTTFTVRNGFDMQITINRDGSVQQKETRIGKGWGGYAKKTPMTSANFTTLLKNIKKQKSISAKTTAVKTAFNNTNNYFTTSQAKQLIQLVSSQPSRLELAQLSYRSITDPDNFSDIDVLLTETNQETLSAYVDTYKINNPRNNNNVNNNSNNNNNSTNSTGYKTPMSTSSYNALYNNIDREWRATEKMTALNNAFTNTNNYFTTSQAGRLIQLVSNENDRLQLAKAAYRSVTDPTNYLQINELLSSQTSKDALTAYVNWYTSNNTSVSNTTNPYKTPMATATFNTLVRDVKNEWMPGAKMNLLTSAFANANNYFSTNQAGQLIQLVTDEENRLQLAKSAYRNITDPASFSQLYQLFSYQANKDALAAYVNSYNGTTGTVSSQYKTPMSDANFNTIVNDVKAQWLPFGKMNALTTTFANPDYNFTASQIKQLIQLVSDEDNRLQLAKSSYRTMTDRANVTQLYDLFSYQASRDALASYVSSYKDSAGY